MLALADSFQINVLLSDWKKCFVLTVTFERWSISAVVSQGIPYGLGTSIL